MSVTDPEKNLHRTDGEVSDGLPLPTSDVHHSREFIEALLEAIEATDEARVLYLLKDIHAADVADLLEF